MATSLRGAVLVLNGNYEPLNITTVKRAIVLLFTGKAEIILPYDGEVMRSQYLEFSKPSVIRLSRYVKVQRREVPLTKKNILRRDNYTCQYCGAREGNMN